jgi:cysteine synthase A
VTVISAPHEYNEENLYVDLRSTLGRALYLKCEGFNFAGSVKLKAASSMVEAAERDGLLRPGSVLVESSSGNLGVALAMIAASRSLRFVCVTDPKCTPHDIALMRATGARVEVVDTPDGSGGYLAARKRRVRELAARPGYVWLNQYENPANVRAHYETTARSIDREFPQLDVLFVGAGTGGTLMGCATYLRDHGRSTTVVAVDSVGSVNFNGSPSPRHIAGLGSSQPMRLIDESCVDDVEWVEEPDSIAMCRRLARGGLVLGGSSGTVVHGAAAWLERHDPRGRLTAVAIAPDFGGSYLDTVYDPAWCAQRFERLRDADAPPVALRAASSDV